jgi:hypothetical protein
VVAFGIELSVECHRQHLHVDHDGTPIY